MAFSKQIFALPGFFNIIPLIQVRFQMWVARELGEYLIVLQVWENEVKAVPVQSKTGE